MSVEAIVIKTAQGFAFATGYDQEAANDYKLGEAIKCELKKQSKRSLQHHKLYFGGLLGLMMDYWEPDSAMTTEAERKLIAKFCKVLDDNGGGGEVAKWGDDFLANLAQSRAKKHETPLKTKKALHRWVKEKVGLVDVIATPDGIKTEVRSINFNRMSQEQFNAFYKDAFNVCWQYVLNRFFDDEVKCQKIIDQLSSMG